MLAPVEQDETPDLTTFTERTTGHVLEGWQRIICTRLAHLPFQTGQRLLIHGPPQHGKSIVISQRFPAWNLGVAPEQRLRVACYNVSHAERFTRVALSLMRDQSYVGLFPDPGARVPAKCPGDEWSTAARARKRDANPSLKALGLGTGFTGLGVDTLIIDDPYKDAQEARSEAVNTMLWDWWTGVVVPRLNPATNIVVMFHRWWEDDFAGKLMAQGGWETMRFPAIADGKPDDPTITAGLRMAGQALSSRYPLAELEHTRTLQGTLFDAQYQGVPFPASGGMFRPEKAEVIATMPAEIRARVRHWDIASTAGGDFTAGVLMASLPGGRYVVEDVVRGQWPSAQRNQIIRQTAELDRARGPVSYQVPQDPGAAGVDMAGDLIRLLPGFSVSAVRESGDKTVRADPLASQWNAGPSGEHGNIALLAADWNRAYLDELSRFPNGKYDDQVDASSGAFNKLAGGRVMQWA